MKEILILLLMAPAFGGAAPGRAARPSLSQTSFRIPGPGCEDGLVLDDGTMETAYGWVPSAIWGEYVQTFPREYLSTTVLDSVCVCWTRSRDDDSLDFELVVYKDRGGVPDEVPFLVIPAHVEGVPVFGEGAFYEIPVPGGAPPLVSGTYHIGVRWNPSVDDFFFLCADQSPNDHPVPGFFRDDRSDGEWGSVLETSDPIFYQHAAMMIRPRATAISWVPALNLPGVLIFIGFMMATAVLLLRRRS